MNRRLEILNSDSAGEDQVLETDIMRFVAIIGIIFWIIFALVKSIPLHPAPAPEKINPPATASPTAPAALNPPVPPQKAAPPIQEDGLPAIPIAPVPKVTAVPQAAPAEDPPHAAQAHHIPPTKAAAAAFAEPAPAQQAVPHPLAKKIPTAQPPSSHNQKQELRLEFSSRSDLFTLLSGGRVAVFCRSQAPGFDLYFAAKRKNVKDRNEVVFTSIGNIPKALWQVTSGADRDYFLEQLARTFPATAAFKKQQVYVTFKDGELENRVEKTYDTLQQEGKGGTITISGTGTVEVRK